jgi:uncharacterized protein (AIM24 family)
VEINDNIEILEAKGFGSAVSGKGLVNVYRGTGRIHMSPIE